MIKNFCLKLTADYLPANLGGRFSINKATPSHASASERNLRKHSFSSSNISRVNAFLTSGRLGGNRRDAIFTFIIDQRYRLSP